MFAIFLLILNTLTLINGYKILGIIPSASYSHQIPFQPIWRELAQKGHQVTTMTTDPIKDPKIKNLREIDMSYTYDIYKKHNFSEVVCDESKSFMEIAKVVIAVFNESFHAQLTSPEVKELLSGKETFDLVILEAQAPVMMGFAWKFNCPFIGVASLDAAMQYHDSAGNPTHPLVNPDNNLPIEDVYDMTFKERLISFIFNTVYKFRMYYRYYPQQSRDLKGYFGADLPDYVDIQNNMSMLFVSTNPIFHNPRPIGPNTIEIGYGLHIKEPKPLPKDIKKFLDGGKDGVIYFSLGTNIPSHLLNETTKQAIVTTFAKLPYRVLWKIDHTFENLPKNIHTAKWLPQQDILRHKNIKLFITQGGLQSLQEALVNGIPIIGIPFFGDQIMNVQRMVKKGYGLKTHAKQISAEFLESSIKEVIENPIYRETAIKLGKILMDQPESSIDRAVWWIEYVIRTNGATHLRNLSVGMPMWKYYLIDVIGFFVGILLVLAYISVKLINCLVRRIRKIITRKCTKKQHKE